MLVGPGGSGRRDRSSDVALAAVPQAVGPPGQSDGPESPSHAPMPLACVRGGGGLDREVVGHVKGLMAPSAASLKQETLRGVDVKSGGRRCDC